MPWPPSSEDLARLRETLAWVAERSPWYRRAFWAFVANAVFLGWLGSKPAEGIYVLLAQLATTYYFAFFFLLLPVLGLIETPRRLPNSITEAVLAQTRPASSRHKY